tara:strand:- start:4070 stop:4336 length:267 start_codon:yes stop_codon:yes gene_type:complete
MKEAGFFAKHSALLETLQALCDEQSAEEQNAWLEQQRQRYRFFSAFYCLPAAATIRPAPAVAVAIAPMVVAVVVVGPRMVLPTFPMQR